MSDWWTYRLPDFLMFSPGAYGRLIERYNRETWPLHLLMLAAGVWLLWMAWRADEREQRLAPFVLAAAWGWVGWAFHHEAYAQINWAADYLALVCAAQAALLLWAGRLRPPEGARGRPAARGAALALLVLGVLVYPLTGRVLGWPGLQAETFGLMPEPTALATMGGLLAFAALRRAWLWPIPLASLCVGLATRSLLWAA